MKKSGFKLYSKILSHLPQRVAISLEFRRKMGYFPNLESPKTLNEKIQWIKVHGNQKLMSDLSDKLKLKTYVTEKLGSQYVLPARWVGNYLPEEMPKQDGDWEPPYVLKANHGCGLNYFVKSAQDVHWGKLKKVTTEWLHKDFEKHLGEYHYSKINKKIFIEKMLEDRTDYKFYCIMGRVEMIVVVIDREYNQKKEIILNRDWQDIGSLIPINIKKPPNLNELIEISEILSRGILKNIPLLRIDMFLENLHPLIGEFTFTPASGYDKDIKHLDLELGKKLKLY